MPRSVVAALLLLLLLAASTWGSTLAKNNNNNKDEYEVPLPFPADGTYPSVAFLNKGLLSADAADAGAWPPRAVQEGSACSALTGCPRAAMAWATGTFTFTELLTAASFSTDARLELKISLCCGYKFKGEMFRDQSLYDVFLVALLQASPFQVLTLEEKRRMFPLDRVLIVDNIANVVYNTTAPVTDGSEGDGDVLILYTGNVGSAAMARVRFNTATVAAGSSSSSSSSNANDDDTPLLSTDVQLKVTNKILKCKCPHTLLVMPLLRAGPDALPPLEIRGLGAHCGERPTLRRVTPHRHVVRIQPTPSDTKKKGHSDDDDASYATMFSVYPPILPASTVTWTVRIANSTADDSLVMQHTRLLPAELDAQTGALLLSSAESPYVALTPHVLYSVHVRVSRGGSAVREHTGTFVLRRRFRRTWDLPAVVPAPHFGFVRRLKLTETLRNHTAVLRSALLPPAVAASSSKKNTQAPYYGYWENAPLEDQPLPQHRLYVPHNPFETDTADVELFFGRNLMAYHLSDADKVCDPVVLEGRELWAVQGIIRTPSPVTACEERSKVEALAVRRLLKVMREEKQFLVNVPHTAWSDAEATISGVPEEGKEGVYSCDIRNRLNKKPPYVGTCEWSLNPDAVGVSGTDAILHVNRAGVYDVVWSATVEVRDAALIVPENMDPAFTLVTTINATAHTVVVRSRRHLVVRRIAAYPKEVAVELPMHARTWQVQPPLPSSQNANSNNNKGKSQTAEDELPNGKWTVRSPFRTLSIDERMNLEMDTNAVPNVQRVLPRGTLHFTAQDAGEDLSASYGVAYHARCPDVLVEYVVTVVAMAAPPVAPALVPVYTEDSCVVLDPPRESRKDEVLEWQVQPCPEAEQPPYIVERTIARAVGNNNNNNTTTVMTPVVLACGIEVYRRCSVVWSAANLVGAVQQTFSLRRCQRPPELVFHAHGGPHREQGIPPRVFSPLPFSEETRYGPLQSSSSSSRDRSSSEPRVVRHTITRSIIPIAGYEGDVAYAFNYSGPQSYFEASFVPVTDGSTSQHAITSEHYYPYYVSKAGSGSDNVSSIVWRKRTRTDVDFAADTDGQQIPAADAYDDDNDNSNDFWSSYQNGGAADDDLAAAPSHSAAAAYEARRRDAEIDRALHAHFGFTHRPTPRHLRADHLGNSSMHPLDYTVRATQKNAPNAAAVEDREEFVKRGMCLERAGYTAILAVNPRGAVREDERFRVGGPLPPPPAPAVAVLPFCSATYDFSRHPHLGSVYGYDFTWRCADTSVIRAEKLQPTHSRLTHVEQSDGSQRIAQNKNESACELSVRNAITGTQRADWFLLRRVYPSKMPFQHFVVCSDNAAELPPHLLDSNNGGDEARRRSADGKVVPTFPAASSSKQHPHAQVIRRVYGKSVVLHVDAPSTHWEAQWSVVSVVPATASTVGSQVIMDAVRFVKLRHHPVAIARGRGGATALVKGLDTPGLYTVAHTIPDPAYPHTCPNVTLVETFEVLHARALEKELVICGDTAHLQADPVPKEIANDFVGVWEVVSIQTAENEIWTSGANFTGIRFDYSKRSGTFARGLPFGIVTFRWSIYKLIHDNKSEAAAASAASSSSGNKNNRQYQQRVLVDYDTVRVLVLTENLRSHRLVTLEDTAEVLTTSSTVSWAVEHDHAEAKHVRIATEQLFNFSSVFGDSHLHDPAFATYYGTYPRLGTGLLTASHLPNSGVVRLRYDLVPSANAFGPMIGHTCKLHGIFEVERVSAFLTAETTMHHECDAYNGKGRITLCLVAKTSPSNSDDSKKKKATPATSMRQASAASSWESRLRLAPLDTIEEAVKRGAQSLLDTQGCATPWWVWPSTRWTGIAPADRQGLPSGRCVSFTATAGRHLSPREAGQPLFVARSSEGGRASTTTTESASTAASASSSCGNNGDFITSLIIDSVSASSTMHLADQREGGGLLARLQHMTRSRHDASARARYLPVLDPKTLQRQTQTALRPMIGQQGLPDEITTEVNVSAGGSATVTLRFDASQPRRLGGFVVHTGAATNAAAAAEEEGSAHAADYHVGPIPSVLLSCINGTVRAGDILEQWVEVNRPDGLIDKVAEEWTEYVQAVRDVEVPCEVLFVSLQHLLTRADKDAAAADESELRRRRVQHIRTRDQTLVSLESIEQQLDSVQRAYRWTKDGIDVTGLRSDLQQALNKRRITQSQLQAIIEARRVREAEESQREKDRKNMELTNAPTLMTRSERLLAALRTYRGVAEEGEVTAIRVALPPFGPFTVPYNLFLRSALHKDVVCGTHLSAAPPVSRNPFAMVPFGRVVIEDVPAAVSPSPAIVKQCEMEGHVPVITINVTGGRFSSRSFTGDRILLEEIPNPDLPQRHHAAASKPGIGLRPCIAQMRSGMQAVVATVTEKHLYLQLSACPTLQMLAQEEYNENQNSEALLERLQYPRLLRVTVKDALRRDSHASSSKATATTTTDITVTIEVRPTLARLHLHSDRVTQQLHHESDGFPSTWNRPLLLCEGDMRRHGFRLGVELIGDHWKSTVGEHNDVTVQHSRRHDQSLQTTTQKQQQQRVPSSIPAPGSNEPQLARRRTPANVALLNSFSIVEHHSLDSTHHLYLKGGGVYRSHFVNYLFSSVLGNLQTLQRHHFVKRYNDTFVSVDVPPQPATVRIGEEGDDADTLWDALYGADDDDDDDINHMDAFMYQHLSGLGGQAASARRPQLPAVRRFSKVEEILFAVPGISTECRGCLLADTTFYLAGDLTGLWRSNNNNNNNNGQQQQQQPLAGPLVVPWYSADAIPRQWQLDWLCPSGARQALQRLQAVWQARTQQQQRYDDVSEGARMTLHAEVVLYTLRDATGQPLPASQRPTTLLASEPVLVSHVLHDKASSLLLSSSRRGGGDALLDPLRLVVNESNVQTAYTTLAADLLRYRRRHHASFDYHQADASSRLLQGRLSVNASVVLKLCIPASAARERDAADASSRQQQQCMVVSITDTLIVVEPPRRSSVVSSFLSKLLPWLSTTDDVLGSEGSNTQSFFSVSAIIHHAALAAMLYAMLPYLGVLTALGLAASPSSAAEEDTYSHMSTSSMLDSSSMMMSRTERSAIREQDSRVGLSIMFFVLMWFSFAYVPMAWIVLWLSLWTAVLYRTSRTHVILLFILSVLYWHYAM